MKSNTTNHSDISQLLEAARMGEFARIKAILNQGIPVDAAGPNGQTALMVAAHHGLPDTLKLLLNRGAKAAMQDEHGDTALHWALSMNDLQPEATCVALLIDAGAELEARNHKGQTPLLKGAQAAADYFYYYAGVVDYAPCLLLLMESSADPGAVDNHQQSVRDIMEKHPQAFIPSEVAPVHALMERIALQRGTRPSSGEGCVRRM